MTKGLMELRGKTALVTGAASGIGRAIAVSLARRGSHVALADVDEAGLAQTASIIPAGGRVSRHRLDVADRQAVAAFPEVVRAEHGGLDLLFNNAGVAIGGTFEQASAEDFEWLFEINFWGVVRVTRAFLPLLKASGDARIVNISSIFGIVAPPRSAAYCASKFAVRGFSESLRHELDEENSRVGVTVVHPGGVATSIARSARVPKGAPAELVAHRLKLMEAALKMPPEQAGEIIVSGVERRQVRIIVGSDAKFAALLERLAPVSYWRFMRRRLT